jgi:putative ATPase
LARQLGHGRDYRHAHLEEGAYAAGENYFPDALSKHENPPKFYHPAPRGLEAKIRERLDYLRKLDAAENKKKRGG